MNILFLLKQTLDICHISSADVDQDVTFHGRWEVGLNAGGVQKGDFKSFAKNPQVALQCLVIHFQNLKSMDNYFSLILYVISCNFSVLHPIDG